MKYSHILQLIFIIFGEFDAIYPQDPKTVQDEAVLITRTTETQTPDPAAPPFGLTTAKPEEDATLRDSKYFGPLTPDTANSHTAASRFGLQAANFKDTIRTKRYRRNSDVEEIESEEELSNPVYRLKLSEFNFDNPGENDEVFLELEATRINDQGESGRHDLIGYKLVILKGEPLEIVVTVDLHREVGQVTNPYIVLGKGTNKGVVVDLTSAEVESVFSGSTILPDLDDSIYAVLVVFSYFRSELNDLSLSKEHGKFVPKPLDPILRSLIRDITVDMQVLGRKVHANYCSFFDTIRPLQSIDSFRKVLLRDWDSPQEFDRDFSINNCCPPNEFFNSRCWYLGIPTPGSGNDCTRKQIILEEFILDLPNVRLPEVSLVEEECVADYPGISSSSYDLISDHGYVRAVGNSLEGRWACNSVQNAVTPTPEQNVVLLHDNIDIAPSAPSFTFDEEKFKYCRKYLTRIDKITVPEVKEWLNMDVIDGKCIFSCHICKTYFSHGFRKDIKHKTKITNKGYFSNQPYRNKDQILDHIDSSLHQESRKYYMGLKSSSSQAEAREAVERAELAQREIFRPTMNALILGYASIKAGVSFRAYPTIHQGVETLGVALGSHHKNVHSLQQFSETFSKNFHKKLLTHLVEKNVPFSLLSDATTYKNVPYFVCLLQSIEDGHPIIYFWGLIELTNGEASRHIWADVETRIRADESLVPGFQAFFKKNIVTFISDMAGAMIGKKNSVWTHLKTFIEREIPTVSCSNHRLERVIHHALNFDTGYVDKKPFKYYFSFREKNNKFYSFYMSFGSKRWAHLTETAKELGLTPHRIKYHFSIRWAASSKKAMDTLYRDYDILVADLESISEDSVTQSKETMDKARDLFNIISDKTFAITVAEFVDFLSVFEKMSLALQTKSALLIGKVAVLRLGFLEIRDLKLRPGPKVTELLSKCSCEGLCHETECNLSQYDSCQKVLKNNIELSDIDTTASKLSKHRITLYDNIELQLKKYFDSEQLEAFELFNPRNFRYTCASATSASTCSELETCYKSFLTIDPDSTPTSASEKFTTVCNFYSFSTAACTNLVNRWKLLLDQIVTSSYYERMEYDDPSVFWPNVLSDDKITIHNDVKSFIERILVTGLSNSESERAFSMSTRYKSGDRSSLSTKNLEALLRISINGPDVLSEDSIYNYAKDFLTTHARVDDAHGGGRIKADLKSYFAKSRLF